MNSIDIAALVGPPDGPPLAGPELEERAGALGATMRCPVCQGLSIADSPSSSATSMLSHVHELLAAGYSERQILSYFEGSYGEFVLLQPKAEGFNLFVWLAPLAAILAGLTLIVWRVRGGGRRAGATTADTEDLDEYLQRVRSEASR